MHNTADPRPDTAPSTRRGRRLILGVAAGAATVVFQGCGLFGKSGGGGPEYERDCDVDASQRDPQCEQVDAGSLSEQ